MKHLKKFNEELKHETYLSAGLKLKALGHKKRAQDIFNYASDKNKLDRLDPNKYEIEFENDNLHIGNEMYQIIDVFKGNHDSSVKLSDGLNNIRIAFNSKRSDDDVDDANNYLWISLEENDFEPYFKFQNRKDALNFRRFVIDEFGKCPISINYMYKEKEEEE